MAAFLSRRRAWRSCSRAWLCVAIVALLGRCETAVCEGPQDAATVAPPARLSTSSTGGALRPESVGNAEVLRIAPEPRLPNAPPPYPVSAKILRYAERLVKQYDTNNDGRLQEEEWEKMRGNPKAMDSNRDGVITTEDLARYIARYGRAHRLQLMISPPPVVETATLPPLFQPASKGSLQQSPTAVLPQSVAAGSDTESDEEDAEDAADADAASAAGEPAEPSPRPWKRPPRAAQQKFFVSPRALPPGTPQWFRLRDLDGDGQVSLAEFAPSPTQSDLLEFSRYDYDRDGVITIDDLMRLNRAAMLAPKPAAAAAAASRLRAIPGAAGAAGAVGKHPKASR